MGRLLEALRADSEIGLAANPANPANPRGLGPERFADSQDSQTLAGQIRERFADSQDSQGVTAEIRTRLLTLSAADQIAHVHRLHPKDLTECRQCTDDELRGYLRALDYSARMDAGQAPPGYTQAAECSGCGPVLLWPGAPASVIACPWCFRRRAGKAIPRPVITKGSNCK